MDSSSSPREIIQISLGPSVNAITAHLLNLQGLAATSSSCSDDIYCDPNTTHYNHRGSGTLVPRVLIVDEANHQVSATATGGEVKTSLAHSNVLNPSLSSANNLWNGDLQVLGDTALSATTMDAWNHGHQNVAGAFQITSPFWKTASAMAYSPHSRYSYKKERDHLVQKYRANPNNDRHVVWDDDEEEEEDLSECTFREEQSERHWKLNTAVSLGQTLDAQISDCLKEPDEGYQSQESLPSSAVTRGSFFNHWTGIWMPPRNEKSKIVLPFSSQSQLVPYWNVSYQGDGNNSNSTIPFLQEWKEEVLFENVRHMLEACDYGIQGVTISTEGHGIYASLATFLLEELKQECKSACRLVYHLRNVEENMSKTMNQSIYEDRTWQEAKIDEIRKRISSGLALHDFTEKAHAVLPLQLSKNDDDDGSSSHLSFFRDTARLAMALEVSTLPFRFNGNNGKGCHPTYQMGLQNAPFLANGASDTSWGSTTSRLTFSEYLQVLQPSSSYSMLELDVISQLKNEDKMITNEKLYELIQEGTSVERDRRTRESRGHLNRTRPREVSPGSWLQDACFESTRNKGLLSSLSYHGVPFDRSSQHHFAMSTSIRQNMSSLSSTGEEITIPNYLTCLIQGMGIQYRPERSMATVLNHSLGQMTFRSDGGTYGAGIYWKHILPHVDTPVLAVLGNSTRSYASLNEIAKGMQEAIKTRRFRGYFNRDVSNGVLPEFEDCEEALEACWSKRDVYQPSSGSDLFC